MSSKNISLIFLLLCTLCHSQTAIKPIYSVEILKIVQKNGKNAGAAQLFIDNKGTIERDGFKNEKINVETFSKSMNALVANEQKVIKVDADNDKRPGIQEPYNGRHVYITIIYQEDFDNEPNLKNNTCYRYRETDLPENLECDFFKYLDKSDLKIIKKFLH